MLLKTPRLTLLPATAVLARAEIQNRAAFAALLNAAVPDAWPPELLADALAFFLQKIESAPEQTGWFTWYGVADGNDGEPPTLIASGGFFGPPQDGSVEIGYSVLPRFQQKGYGAEMVGALADWALAQSSVHCVAAAVALGNTPSHRLLRRLGFSELGVSEEPGHIRYEKTDEKLLLS